MSDILPKYAFFPWLKQGIANEISETDTLGSGSSTALERAKISVKVKIKSNGTSIGSVDSDVKLVGPGDILGISHNAVVNTDPLRNVDNFEPNYFPYVEFYDEDFAWRYTPAQADNNSRLRPWLFLVVLKKEEFERNEPLQDGLPASITVKDAGKTSSGSTNGPFPDHDEIWAWAHVHLSGDVDLDNEGAVDQNAVDNAINRFSDILNENPDLGVSRLICPRKLDPVTQYYAFIIPSFETGRLAGLGAASAEIASVKAQQASWGFDHTVFHDRFPVYHEWTFSTGHGGDFEQLVRKLKPRELDNRVGRRAMDISDPGFLLSYNGGKNPLKGTLALEGALRIPGNEGEKFPWLSSLNFRKEITALVNLGEDITLSTFGSGGDYYETHSSIGGADIKDDPIVAPPLYGRWHALKKKIKANGRAWVDELNIDPRNRVVASIGTAVIQKNQDKYMDMAWEQVGAIIEANKKLQWTQLAKETSEAVFRKHLKNQPAEHLIPMTAKMHKRIKSVDKTLFRHTVEKALPIAAQSKTFRKLKRINGPILKRLDPQKTISGAKDNIMVQLDQLKYKAAQPVASTPATKQLNQNISILDTALNQALSIKTTKYHFNFTAPLSTTSVISGNSSKYSVEFKNGLLAFANQFATNNWTALPAKVPLGMVSAKTEVLNKIEPKFTLKKRVYQQLNLPEPDKIVPILAAPSIKQPMYETVRDISNDYLIPNLHLIPRDTISLLETNQKFIESFMVGVNHEMGRELLWREFPTDQRGTVFKHFWDTSDVLNVDGDDPLTFENKMADIGPIHKWLSNSRLGKHDNRASGGSGSSLVLVIKGDLLKKFPDAVIYAVQAEWQLDQMNVIDTKKHRVLKSAGERYPMFGAKIEPDITFLGFDLTEEEARGDDQNPDGSFPNNPDPGWFFVIKERPGEPRFGLDVSSENAKGESWNDLAWNHLPANTTYVDLNDLSSTGFPVSNLLINDKVVRWGQDSAQMAQILYQSPVLIAIHANEMLPDKTN